MCEECVGKAVEGFGLEDMETCVTEGLRLVNNRGWSKNMFLGLAQWVSDVLPFVLLGDLTFYCPIESVSFWISWLSHAYIHTV